MTSSENGLQLIAIKPLSGCNIKHLKNLKTETIYPLCNNYSIATKLGGEETVSVAENAFPDIYSIGDMKVNVCAIVGKNGTGKSSLIELFFAALYNISKATDLIRGTYTREQNVNVAIYYGIDCNIYKVELIGARITLYQYNKESSTFVKLKYLAKKKDLAEFFYTIGINYSHYALNSKDVGPWIDAVFDKNDAYQAPIVINPFRDKGKIDVNSENHLVRSRLLTNILDGTTSVLSFSTGDKVPTTLNFTIDLSKFQINKKNGKVAFNRTNDWEHRVFPAIYEIFFGIKQFKPEDRILNKYAKEYILIKLHNIVKKYGHYQTFRGFYKGSESSKLIKYLIALKDDESHITFKLKQAINFLVLDIYPKDRVEFTLNVDETILKLQNQIRENDKGRMDLNSSGKTIPIIELIPPSFLKMDMEFSDKDDKFSYLSSGEKQKIYTSSSLIYHLKNLESSLKNAEKKDQPFENLIRYKHINVIFDEIELYYHPDLQRRFLNDLLSNIRNARIEKIASLNFIFVTHSPFILSDISQDRILYLDLDEGKSVSQSIPERTFGANIHDLLANSFFLKKEGYMGEFAKTIIKDAFNYLKDVKTENTSIRWSKESVRALIDMIGEPLIYRSMNELYSNAFLKTNSQIDEEIKRLEQLKKKTEL